MGVLTSSTHEYWATISGSPLTDLLEQDAMVRQWGVSAVEYRADLIPPSVYDELLAKRTWTGPTFIAHFGTGAEAQTAHDAVVRAIEAGVLGGICHSHCELATDIQRACSASEALFAAAYHSQEPLTCKEAVEEFERQEALGPLFRKIAVRAHSFEEALALIEATYRASQDGGSPVVGAIFGPQRWARLVMPHAGSAVSFILAHPVRNEGGSDDEQLVVREVDAVLNVRGVLPAPDRLLEGVGAPALNRSPVGV